MTNATILAIESSCDETAVSIIRGNKSQVEILSSEVTSQIDLHKEYGGVVPELASRNHSLTLRPLVEQALKNANIPLSQIDAFAATAGPGLASSLLIGHTSAKALAVSNRKPFLSVNHMEGHLISPFIDSKNGIQPNTALVVSGGHTMILQTKEFGDYELLGKTLDDAAGEAFDKVAKMLELPYPGGPQIELQAQNGNPTAYPFPRSMKNKPHFNFSFSGLKTAVLYTLSELNPQDGTPLTPHIPDICASFQKAVTDILIHKTINAAKSKSSPLITLSGGVSCNNALRDAFTEAGKKNNIAIKFCPPSFTTDNAAMIAFVGLHMFLRGESSDLSCDIDPNMRLNSIIIRK